MSKKLMLITVLFILLFSFMAAFADNDGYNNWCNEDEYGCWVTDEDGGKCYIMFWSEEARAYFMGGLSKPGQLVFDKPNTSNGRFGLEKGPRGPKNYKDLFIELIKKYGETVEGELEYYQNNDVFISEETYNYAVNWYKVHSK